MPDESPRAVDLLTGAYAGGELSEGSKQALLRVGDGVASEVGQALGQDIAEIGDCLLVTLLIDDSASIAGIAHGPQAVRDGHNLCLDALRTAGAEVLVSTRALNHGLLSPYRALTSAVRLHAENYQPNARQTPLFQQAIIALGSVMAKTRELNENDCRVRTFTLLITDSQDNASAPVTAADVRFLVQDMLEFSDQHIVAGMGIGDPGEFQRVFGAMGIPPRWILPSNATAGDIERLFRLIARQLELAVSSESTFRQLMAGPRQD